MFYNYTIPLDSASAVQYSKAVGAASASVADLQKRVGPVIKIVDAETAQFAGHVPLSVGMHLSASAGMLASSIEYGFLSPIVLAPTSQGQSASESYLYTASLPLFSQLSYLADLYFPRLYHEVSATQSPNTARWGRGLALAFGVNTPSNLISDEFTDEFGVGPGGHVENLAYSIGHLVNQTISAPETGAQSTALTNSVSRLLQFASASSALIFLGPGRIFRAVGHGNIAHRLLSPGKLAGAASSAAADSVRATGLHESAVSPQSAWLAFGGNIYVKLAPTVTTQVLAVGRGIAALRGAISIGRVAAVRSVARLLGATGATVVSLTLAVGWRRGVAAARSVVLLRSTGLPRAVAGTSVASMRQAAAYLRTLAGVAQAAVAYLAPPAVTVTFFKTLPTLQSSSARLSTIQAYLRALALTQAQEVGLIFGIGRLLVTSSASVAGGVRSIAKSVAVSALSVVVLSRAAAHFVVAQAFGSVLLATLRASRVIFGTTQSQVSNVSFGYEKFVHVFPNVAMASAASALRLTGKLIGAATRQIAAHIRSFISLALPPVAQIQATSSVASRAVMAGVATVQRSQLVKWFLLFIPEWAYQQSVFYPPDGGPPEPPVFGPLDPGDRSLLGFDWSKRMSLSDRILSATVVSVPPGLSFVGPVLIQSNIVRVTVGPFTPAQIPVSYRLRCSAVFASGRRSSFSVPVIVERL